MPQVTLVALKRSKVLWYIQSAYVAGTTSSNGTLTSNTLHLLERLR